MTGIEKILGVIEADAKANAESIIAQAKSEAEEVAVAARKEAEGKCAVIAMQSEADVKEILSRAEAAARLQEKKIILDAKQQIISNIITSARNSIHTMPDSAYADLLIQLIKKYIHRDSGDIIFSKADRKRLPSDFQERLKAALAETQGASLTISDKVPDFEGGFLLKYGDIEENCSFDALFSAQTENLQDRVNTLLFQ